MKRILVCIFVFLVTATSIYADEEVVDGVSWGYSLKNGTVTIERRYDSSGFAIYYQGDLVVPNQIKGYPVTTIATYAFQGCPELKSVVLPNSVVEIKSTVGYYNHGAFENCSKLERVTLPKGLKIIEPGTFSGCSSLNQIILPFGLEIIGSEAFYGCSSLLEIDVPSSVVFIGEDAFDGCSSANTISLREGLLGIGEGAFYGCKSVKTISIPSTVTNVAAFAFSKCPKLEEVVIPSCAMPLEDAFRDTCVALRKVAICDGVAAIPNRAFKGCENVESIGIPASVVSIGYASFSSTAWWVNQPDGLVIQDGCCVGIKGVCPSNVEIPPGVRLIAGGAFEKCYTLVGVNIPDGVVTIGSSAFAYCGSLTTVDIPQSVVRIGYDAFWHCSKLSSVVLPTGLTEIEESSFNGCSELALVEIPEGVTNIGRSAFSECSALKSVHIPGSVVNIDSEAFGFCGGLEKVIIEEGVKHVGDMAFCQYYYGSSLREVVLPEGLVSIGKSAFADCTNLKNITIPASVEVIGDSAFNRSGLIDVLIRPGVKEVGDYAFAGCNKLTSITIPASVRAIGSYAFRGTSLSEVAIEKGVQRIGDFAFTDCRNLSLLSLPEDLEDIGEGAFKGCSLLKDDMGFVIVNNILFDYVWDMWTDVPSELQVPVGVKSISAEAFNGCDRPRTITLPESVTTIGRSAFRNCRLSSVTIPASVTKIRPGAFYMSFADGDARVTSADLKKWCEITFDTNSTSKTELPYSNPLYGAHRLFLGANEITALQIPAGIEEIKPYSFAGATNINSVIIPNGVTNIGDHAFTECNGLTSMSIPDSVIRIGERAFYKCNALTALTIPKGVNDFGYGAFEGCVGLASVTIENGVKHIGRNMFEGCAELSSVSMPDSLTHIADGAFANCKGLTEINVPIGVTSIGTESFYGCSALTTITVHRNVTTIGSNAFWGCRLSTVYVDFGDTARVKRLLSSSGCSVTNVQFVEKDPTEDDRGPGAWTDPKTGLTWEYCDYYYFDWDDEIQDGGYVCDGGITIIKVSPNPTGELQIPASIYGRPVRSVDQPWCYGNMEYYDWGYDDEEFLNYCDELTAVIFPDTIKEIGPDMVRYCPNLTSVYLPEGLISIGKYSFMDCGLTSIEYPSTLQSDISYIWKSPIVSASIRGGNNDYFLFEDGGMYSTGDDYSDGVIQYGAVKHGKLIGSCRNIQMLSVREGCVQLRYDALMSSLARSVFLPRSLKMSDGHAICHNQYLVSVCFSGRPIAIDGSSAFYNDCPNVTTYVPRNMGWEDVVTTGTWQGRPIKFLDEYVPEPVVGGFLPELSISSSEDDVRAAFAGAVDLRIKKNITDIESYRMFRQWANDIGVEKVQVSPQAWTSFALNLNNLLPSELIESDLKVEAFTPSLTEGLFDFAVSVKDAQIGSNAYVEYIKTIFGVEGSPTLDSAAFNQDSVTLKFTNPMNGKLKISAGPADKSSKAFFMKMKIKK